MRKQIVAGIVGFLTFSIIGLTSIFWGQVSSVLADKLSSDATRRVFKGWTYDNPHISNAYLFLQTGLAVSLGLAVTFMLLDFKDRYRRRLSIYLPFLIVILATTTYNYLHFDYIIRPDIQVIFNILLVFLSSVWLVKLWTINFHSNDGQILKYLIIFLVGLGGLTIPLFFSICWFFQRLGLEIPLDIDMPILTTICGLVTTIVTIQKYRTEKKKKEVVVD
jgi:hypothetical protein